MNTLLATIDLSPVTDRLADVSDATLEAASFVFASAATVACLIWFGLEGWKLFKSITREYDDDEDRARYDETHDKF